MLLELEGKRAWWCGRTSNPVGGVSRSRVGSTPTSFRQLFYSCSESENEPVIQADEVICPVLGLNSR